MDEHDWVTGRFEEHRGHLRAVAYRMLGSLSEADDAVQEAWLRLSRSETSGVWRRPRGSRREEPLGLQVGEPIAGHTGGTDPEQEALLADSVGLALLVV